MLESCRELKQGSSCRLISALLKSFVPVSSLRQTTFLTLIYIGESTSYAVLHTSSLRIGNLVAVLFGESS